MSFRTKREISLLFIKLEISHPDKSGFEMTLMLIGVKNEIQNGHGNCARRTSI